MEADHLELHAYLTQEYSLIKNQIVLLKWLMAQQP